MIAAKPAAAFERHAETPERDAEQAQRARLGHGGQAVEGRIELGAWRPHHALGPSGSATAEVAPDLVVDQRKRSVRIEAGAAKNMDCADPEPAEIKPAQVQIALRCAAQENESPAISRQSSLTELASILTDQGTRVRNRVS